jgi:Salmonella virulence plasmid 65kDa B protein/FG-GAP-like repeat
MKLFATDPRRSAIAALRLLMLGLSGLCAFNPALAQVGVSNAGTANYTLPIAVPPGIANMAPQLALTHTGGTADGPVGVGWAMQGQSAITRCNGLKRIDRRVSGVNFSPADALCLDGQRLIVTDGNGTPLDAAAQADAARGGPNPHREYRTETDSFSRIRAYGFANGAGVNGPAYFRVWSKAGLVSEYGASPSAAADAQGLISPFGSAVAMVWALTHVSDAKGNYMSYRYDVRDALWGSGTGADAQAGREWNLADIQYTGRAGQSPTSRVIFEYQDNFGFGAEAWNEGSKNVHRRRLVAVRTAINAGAVPVTTYKLAYEVGSTSRRWRLTNVATCSGRDESKCLPATKFAYTEPVQGDAYVANAAFDASGLNTLQTLPNANGVVGILTGDFNGDGLTDFIRWSDDPLNSPTYLSNGDGTFRFGPAILENLNRSDGCYMAMVVDVNGDGLSDILRFNSGSRTDGTACPAADNAVFVSTGYSFVKKPIVGPDLKRRISTKRSVEVGCGSGQPAPGPTTDPNLTQICYLHTMTQGDNFYVMDVDGDGRADIVVTRLPAHRVDERFFEEFGDPCPGEGTACTRVYLGRGDGAFDEVATNMASTTLNRTGFRGGQLG